MNLRLLFALSSLLVTGVALANDAAPQIAETQIYDQPPADIDAPGEAPVRTGPDAGAQTLRIEKLEHEVRRLTGENEELQHKIQVLEEQLRTAKQEPPRLSEASKPAERAAAATPSTPGSASTTQPAAGAKKGDAFDPANAPSAPGAPRPLGSTQPSAPLANAPSAAPVHAAGQPLDIAHGRLLGEQPAAGEAAAPAAGSGPKDDYEHALATLRGGKFEEAEKAFAAFLAKNGKSKYAPAATFNLGESFFLRGRYREAAEKYLEISTKFAQSGQAPDALLRLGQSLGAMGAKEQACASLNEIGVKYPGAAQRIKDAVQREGKKLQC